MREQFYPIFAGQGRREGKRERVRDREREEEIYGTRELYKCAKLQHEGGV